MSNSIGLTTKKAKELLNEYGPNEIRIKSKDKLPKKIISILSEPIYVLLASAATIYFVLGETIDGILMIAFVLFVIGIDVLQETRTGNALKKLRELTQPGVKVIRDGKEVLVKSIDLVPGDAMLISEGVKIPCDGELITSTGLCVDESILTGEAEGVWKEPYQFCYGGTLVVLGNGTVIVRKTGNDTEYAQIADKVVKCTQESSLLQRQMRKLAKQCTKLAIVLLFLIGIVTFFNLQELPIKQRLIESFLAGVVLALSMVPGEFPVILSVFLSMGALRLAKKHALVRRLSAVESLGAVSVLCVDKTGTITKNSMEVKEFWHPDFEGNGLCRAIALACKEDTYDPMEIAILNYCGIRCHKGRLETDCLKACILSNPEGIFLRDYPFTNELKAMGQVWQFDDESIIAAKGSSETILPLCALTLHQEKRARMKIEELSGKGLRVIAVAERILRSGEDIPDSLLGCRLFLKGLIGLSDPPRDNISDQITACYRAGIRIIMITGDYPTTASCVAREIGMNNHEKVLTGNEITGFSDQELREQVKQCNIFARVLPFHKMRIVKALKDNGEVTAMTGDGVNDSPAIKIADIGVAMGMHGSEVSREAADLVLLDDNLQTILDSVKDGRRIYQNITKAIGYVFAIHIPIALISLTAPLMGIDGESLMLLPLHIVLLELVMDPTCSVALERQPAEDEVMNRPPRNSGMKLMSTGLLVKSLMQGLAIYFVSFYSYYILLKHGYTAETARTAGYSILVLSNIFLVLVNCSEKESIIRILTKISKERGIWIVNLITLLELYIMIYTPAAKHLKLTPLPLMLNITVVSLAFISVFWYEFIKLIKRRNIRNIISKH